MPEYCTSYFYNRITIRSEIIIFKCGFCLLAPVFGLIFAPFDQVIIYLPSLSDQLYLPVLNASGF